MLMFGGANGTDWYVSYLNRKLLGKPVRPEHEEPPNTAEGMWLFRLWETLHHGRGSNGFGPTPLQFSEVAAYCQLTQIELNHWLLHLLRQIDNLWLSAWVKRHAPIEEEK